MVSILVPARNEERSLGACLASLVAQREIDFELLLIDDHSTDKTAAIASSFTGVEIVQAPPLTPDWTGKNNALAAGAAHARGEWLLFTDADTIHQPGCLAAALRETQRRGVDLLSYSPRQIVSGFIQKALMPVIFAELAAIYPPSQVSDSSSPLAAANGQFILISRDAYKAVGGHAAIGSEILEDVALAKNVKASGRKIFFRYGGEHVATRMYSNAHDLIEGWSKNLALLLPHPTATAAKRWIEFLAIVASDATAAWFFARGDMRDGALAAIICGGFGIRFLRRIARANFSADANLLSFFGLPLFAGLVMRSKRLHKRKAVSWKGRIYSLSGRSLLRNAASAGRRDAEAQGMTI